MRCIVKVDRSNDPFPFISAESDNVACSVDVEGYENNPSCETVLDSLILYVGVKPPPGGSLLHRTSCGGDCLVG